MTPDRKGVFWVLMKQTLTPSAMNLVSPRPYFLCRLLQTTMNPKAENRPLSHYILIVRLQIESEASVVSHNVVLLDGCM